MDPSQNYFLTSVHEKTLLVVPTRSLNELAHLRLEEEANRVVKQFCEGRLDNVVVDFQQTDYFGSTALGFFVKLWKKVLNRGGKMFICGISDHEREILETTRLDQLWPIFPDRGMAMAALEHKRI